MKHFQVITNRLSAFIFIHFVASVPLNKLYRDTATQKQFFVESDLKYNWFQAWNECAAKNMSLATIDTHEKNSVLIKTLSANFDKHFNFWIAGNDLAKPGTFSWYTTGKKFEFTNWSKGNPDHHNIVERCVHVYDRTEYEWNDGNCLNEMGFVCEKSRSL